MKEETSKLMSPEKAAEFIGLAVLNGANLNEIATQVIEEQRKQAVDLFRRSGEFWNDWVYPEGATPEDIQNELTDYRFLMEEVPKAYCDLTRNRISKPNTYAYEVINVAREIQEQEMQEAIQESVSFATTACLADIDALRQVIEDAAAMSKHFYTKQLPSGATQLPDELMPYCDAFQTLFMTLNAPLLDEENSPGKPILDVLEKAEKLFEEISQIEYGWQTGVTGFITPWKHNTLAKEGLAQIRALKGGA